MFSNILRNKFSKAYICLYIVCIIYLNNIKIANAYHLNNKNNNKTNLFFFFKIYCFQEKSFLWFFFKIILPFTKTHCKIFRKKSFDIWRRLLNRSWLQNTSCSHFQQFLLYISTLNSKIVWNFFLFHVKFHKRGIETQ